MCAVTSCARPARSRGWCLSHYMRWYRGQTVEGPLDTHEQHGWYGTQTYKSWDSMKQRCTNPNYPHWKNYGGRGISMDPRWEQSFIAFLADVGERPLGTSIDRIDNDGDYESGNVRWATPLEQNQNRRPRQRLEV